LRGAVIRAGMPREGDPEGRVPGEDLAPDRLLAASRTLDDPLVREDDARRFLFEAAVALKWPPVADPPGEDLEGPLGVDRDRHRSQDRWRRRLCAHFVSSLSAAALNSARAVSQKLSNQARSSARPSRSIRYSRRVPCCSSVTRPA